MLINYLDQKMLQMIIGFHKQVNVISSLRLLSLMSTMSHIWEILLAVFSVATCFLATVKFEDTKVFTSAEQTNMELQRR